MGNVLNKTFNNEMQDKFAGCNVYTKENCGGCFAKYFCSGGCVANSVIYEGNINKPHAATCDMMKKRIELAMLVDVAEKGE